MTLNDFMQSKGLKDQAAADELGIDRSFVANLRTGRRRPSIEVAARIETWSGGEVKASSFATGDESAADAA